jgi:hypothetical protein
MPKVSPASIATMHALHGVRAGETCADCAYCVQKAEPHVTRGAVKRPICRAAPMTVTTHGSTVYPRWVKAWPACGKFLERDV